RLAAISRALLSEGGRRRSNSDPIGFGQRGGSGSHPNGVAGDLGAAKFTAPHAGDRRALRGTESNQHPLSRLAVALALHNSGGAVSQKPDILFDAYVRSSGVSDQRGKVMVCL